MQPKVWGYAYMLLRWSRTLPEHRLDFETWYKQIAANADA